MVFKSTINRRHLLALGAMGLTQSVFALGEMHSDKPASHQLYLSAASNSDDEHWVSGFTLHEGHAQVHFKHTLPGRAHHIAVHQQSGLYVVVARRPGKYLLIGDLSSGEILTKITLPEGRHLFGHGIFSADGRHFYTPENDYQNLQGDNGRITVWSVLENKASKQRHINFERINDFPSCGVGPHELAFMPDNKTLVLANGGIRTHPDSGREKLNLDTMQPSLVYVDAETGELLEQHILPTEFHQSSIRHLDVNAAGKVALGMQYDGEAFQVAPLLATHQRGEELVLLKLPEILRQEMKQYVGSVRFDRSGQYFAASSPRGNIITVWDAESGQLLKKIKSRDGCGVCAADDGFVFTAGTGRISHYNLHSGKIEKFSATQDQKVFWDNHLTKVALA